MTVTNRETLKGYFADGKRPTGSQFADMIDSSVNVVSDGIILPKNDQPLGIKAIKAETNGKNQRVLDFYEHTSDAPTWRLGLTADSLSIGDSQNTIVTLTSGQGRSPAMLSITGDLKATRIWAAGAPDGADIKPETVSTLLQGLKVTNIKAGQGDPDHPMVEVNSVPEGLKVSGQSPDPGVIDYNALLALLIASTQSLHTQHEKVVKRLDDAETANPAPAPAAGPSAATIDHRLQDLHNRQTVHQATLEQHGKQLDEHQDKLQKVGKVLREVAKSPVVDKVLGSAIKGLLGLL